MRFLYLIRKIRLIFIMLMCGVALAACSPLDEAVCSSGFFHKSSFDSLSDQSGDRLRSSILQIGKACSLQGEDKGKYLMAFDKVISSSTMSELIQLYSALDSAGLDEMRLNLVKKSDGLKLSSSPSIISNAAGVVDVSEVGRTVANSNLTEIQRAAASVLAEDAYGLSDERVVTGKKEKANYYMRLWSNNGGSGGADFLSIEKLSDSGFEEPVVSESARGNKNFTKELTVGAWGTGGSVGALAVVDGNEMIGLLVSTEIRVLTKGSLSDEPVCEKVSHKFWELDKGGVNLLRNYYHSCEVVDKWSEVLLKKIKEEKQPPASAAQLINYDRLDAADRVIIAKLVSMGSAGKIQLIDDISRRFQLSNPVAGSEEIVARHKALTSLLKSLQYLARQNPDFDSSFLIRIENGVINLGRLVEGLPMAMDAADAYDAVKDFKLYELVVNQQMNSPGNYGDKIYPFVYEAFVSGMPDKLVLVVSDQPKFGRRGIFNVYGHVIAKESIKLRQELGGFVREVDVIEVANDEKTEAIKKYRKSGGLVASIAEQANSVSVSMTQALINFKEGFL